MVPAVWLVASGCGSRTGLDIAPYRSTTDAGAGCDAGVADSGPPDEGPPDAFVEATIPDAEPDVGPPAECRLSCFGCCGARGCQSGLDVGACGLGAASCVSCPTPANGNATCAMGACDFTCNPGYVRCGAGCCPTTKLAVGSAHACAIVRAGEVRCWGGNSAGQLGDGTTTDSATPVSVSGLSSGAVAVAAGLDHTCALTGAGTVLCWGNNTSGQLGDGSTVSQSVPVAVVGLSDISAIGTGGSHSCAVSRAGAVQCWGENEFGQLGDGMSGSTAANTMPRSVVGLSSRALAIAGGASHTCALTDQGTVQCWGFNDYGQVGGSVNGAGSNEPFTVPGLLPGIVSIAANGDHTCAINGSGGVQCWGDDRFGEAGDGTTSNQAVPTPSNVLGFSSGAIGIATGFVHACALSAAGGVQCWGRGPLGDGSSADSAMPVTVQGLPSGLVTIGAGYYNTCVATIDGQVLCWGMVPSPVLGL